MFLKKTTRFINLLVDVKKMKIVFVHPRILDNYSHPLGIMYIAAVLEEEGHDVKIIDPGINDSIEKIASATLKEEPDMIGITAVTLQFGKAYDIAKEIKKNSEIPILIGGMHATVKPMDTAKYDCFDYVIVGEGEETTLELFKAIKEGKELKNIKGLIYKKNKKVMYAGPSQLIKDIDKLPIPARHLLPEEAYFAPPKIRAFWSKRTANVMIARGCPFRCIFCSSHLIFGRDVRFRSPEKVIQEIKLLREKYNIDSLKFDDDTFTSSHEWTRKFCKLLKKMKKDLNWNNLKWVCQTRVNSVNPEILKEMKEAGCTEIDFGVESGSPRMLNILKKGITVPQIITAFDAAKKAGILRGATFIVGIPGEKEEDFILTEKLIKRIKADFADVFFAVPFPGTVLAELAKKSGAFHEEDVKPHEWLMNRNTDKPVMSVSMSEKKLIYWRSRLHNINFWRNYAHLIKDPQFIIGGIFVFFKGYRGWVPGIKRVLKTGKFDSFFVTTLYYYRLGLKKSVLESAK